MKLIIVNEQDEPIGLAERDARTAGQIIRVSGIWILNTKGEALVAQRAYTKFHDPGRWAVSAAGTVEEDETYPSNIIKEVQEELGIALAETDLILGSKRLVNTDHQYFCQMYLAILEDDAITIQMQKEEVEAVRWVSVADLEKWHAEKPDDFIESFDLYLHDLRVFSHKS